MKRIAGSITAALFAIFLGSTITYALYTPEVVENSKTHTQGIPTEIVDYYTDSVFKVIVNHERYGSAFFVGDGELITSCHLFKGEGLSEATEVVLRNYNETIEVKVTDWKCVSDDYIDIAVMHIEKGNVMGYRVIPVLAFLPKTGSTVFTGGYGNGVSLSLSKGHIQPQGIGYATNLFTDVHSSNGDSGGPLVMYFQDRLYLVGVNTFVQSIPVTTFVGVTHMPIYYKSGSISGPTLRYALRILTRDKETELNE